DYPLDGILSAVDQRSYIFYIDPFLSFQFFHIGEFQYFFFKIVNSVAFGIRIIQRKNVPNCLNQNPIYTFPLLHMCAVSFLVGIIMNGYLLKSLLSEEGNRGHLFYSKAIHEEPYTTACGCAVFRRC